MGIIGKIRSFIGGRTSTPTGEISLPKGTPVYNLSSGTAYVSGSGGGRGGGGVLSGSTAQAQAQAQAEAERKAKELAEQKTRESLSNLTRAYNQDVRNITNLNERSRRLNEYLEQRNKIVAGDTGIVSGGKGVSSVVTRDIETGEIKRTAETIRDVGGAKTTIKIDYTKKGQPIRIDTYGVGGGRTGGAYIKIGTKKEEEVKREGVIEQSKINSMDKQYELPRYESKFDQPTKSTRTDLTYEDVRPKDVDLGGTIEKGLSIVGGKIMGFSIKDVSVRDVLESTATTIPEYTIPQKTTISDIGYSGSSPIIKEQKISVQDLISTPIEWVRVSGKTISGGVSLLATKLESTATTIPEYTIPQKTTISDIGYSGSSPIIKEQKIPIISKNIAETIRLGGKVAGLVPEIALFSYAPVLTSISGIAYESRQGNLAGVGMYGLIGGAVVGGRIIKGIKGLSSGTRLTQSQLEKLQRANPDLTIGISKTTGDKATLIIKTKRSAGRVESNVLAKFDVEKIKGGYQIKSGIAERTITKEPLLFRDKDIILKDKFTFFGEAQPTSIKKVIQSGDFKIIKDLPKDIKGYYGKVNLLGENIDDIMLKEYFTGVSKTGESGLTMSVSKSIKSLKAPKDTLKIIDIKTGKTKIVTIPAERRFITFKGTEIENLALVKDVSKLGRGESLFIPSGVTDDILRANLPSSVQTLKVSVAEQKGVGSITGFAVEKKLISEVKVFPKLKGVKPITSIQETEVVTTLVPTTKNGIVEQVAVKEEPKTRQIFFIESSQKTKQETKQRELTKQITSTKEIQVVKTKQENKLIIGLSNLLRVKQQQEEKQANLLINIFQGFKTPLPPEKPKIIIPITKEVTGEREEEKIIKEDIFSIYGRRYGKDLLLGEFGTKEKSKEELVKFLKGTLGRSGFVEKGGQKISFEELGLGFEFRKSKAERGRIVQKARFSLSGFQEKKEIQQARKKKKNVKFKWM